MSKSDETKMPLRNIQDIVNAQEWLFNQQLNGKMDAKAADALNTTLKGSIFLIAKLRLDAAKIWMTSQVKKINIPPGLLPE